MQLNQLATLCEAKTTLWNSNPEIEELAIDSRKAIISPHTLFIALKGPQHDGHDYIEALYQKGLRNFLVGQTPKEASAMEEANFLKVANTKEALQRLAAFQRQQFDKVVIGITGSNGKTIVKEWLYDLLKEDFYVLKSPKSYNSQVGVPLSVWPLRPHHDMGIFEAGISRPGEMEKLEKIIKPKHGIFTNIGSAHDEGFANRAAKAQEKALLFKEAQLVVYCRDYAEIHRALTEQAGKHQHLIGWSKSKGHAYSAYQEGEEIIVQFEDKEYTFQYPFQDPASFENLTHCVFYLLSQGFPAPKIQKRINELHGVGMRLSLKRAFHNSYLIDDTYNNDFAGLQVALDFLQQQPARDRRIVILSDLYETGKSEAELYEEVNHLLISKSVDRLIGIGPAISRQKDRFQLPGQFFASTEDFLQDLHKKDLADATILVKGARVFGFEQIVNTLQQKSHGTVLEINLEALVHNLNYYKSLLKPQTKMMVMVKAFAYGSGSHEVAHLLQYHRADYLAVAYADEGVALRENGIHIPIMVMNPSPETFDKLAAYALEPEIHSLTQFQAFLDFAKGQEQPLKIHLKIDTGMHRLGFEEPDIPTLMEMLQSTTRLKVASIFSHLAGADEAQHNAFSHEQAKRFQHMSEQIMQALPYRPLRHLTNSPGISRFPEYHFDMVRLGIGLYGVDATGNNQSALEPISTLKTTISQVKHIKKGETVGYSRKGIAHEDMQIATMAIGYADGYQRAFSNGVGKVMVKGKLVPVMGNVCMDMTMIDVSGLSVQEGDEVIIFGASPSIQSLADSLGTIPYEILTNVSERVKRVYFMS